MKLKDWVKENDIVFTDRDLRFLVKNVCSNQSFLEDVCLQDRDINYLEGVKKLYVEGLPLAYIIGEEEFFGFYFKVNPKVLIPRPETELIVEKAIEIIKSQVTSHKAQILDLGCGCGNIAISIKKIIGEKVKVFASDINKLSLSVACENIYNHCLEITLMQADLFTWVKNEAFDLIVSNPPYVDSKSIKGSLKYEPRAALDGGDDGMYFIEKILRQSHFYLKKRGYLIIEMGYNHKEGVENLVEKFGFYDVVEWIRDYSGYWRGVVLKKAERQRH